MRFCCALLILGCQTIDQAEDAAPPVVPDARPERVDDPDATAVEADAAQDAAREEADLAVQPDAALEPDAALDQGMACEAPDPCQARECGPAVDACEVEHDCGGCAAGRRCFDGLCAGAVPTECLDVFEVVDPEVSCTSICAGRGGGCSNTECWEGGGAFYLDDGTCEALGEPELTFFCDAEADLYDVIRCCCTSG